MHKTLGNSLEAIMDDVSRAGGGGALAVYSHHLQYGYLTPFPYKHTHTENSYNTFGTCVPLLPVEFIVLYRSYVLF